MALTGAGISAESGLATFRAADGLWEGHRIEDVATPEAFERNPLLVWEFYEQRRLSAHTAVPNLAHIGLTSMSAAVVTQNVDGLHQRAGSEGVLELHGSLWKTECRNCGSNRSDVVVPLPELPPICRNCGSYERPSIVWFGEGLPMQVWSEAVSAVQECAVCLVIGTSAQVYPAAGLIPLAKRNGAYVAEVNPNETALSEFTNVSVRSPACPAIAELAAYLTEVAKVR